MARSEEASSIDSPETWRAARRRLFLADEEDRVILEPELQAASCARAFVRVTCTRWKVEPVIDAALLVVSELVTNAVSHARSPVTVSLRLCPDNLLVDVEDDDSRLPVVQRNEWDALGGRGLTLVDAMSRAWGAHPCPGGKIVWATLALTG